MEYMTRWYVNVSATVAGLALAGYLGVGQLVWEADVTRISILIGVVWIIATLMIGRAVYRDNILDDLSMAKFLRDLCAGLGMVGTIIGFIVMVQGVELHDAGDTETLKVAVTGMLKGFGTAMYTTLVGTLASLSLSSQLVGED